MFGDDRHQVGRLAAGLHARDVQADPQPRAVAGPQAAPEIDLVGGLELALAADIRLAVDSATFALPEASIGVFVTGGLSATLVASAGLARAKAITLLGEPFTAAQAQAWGLVWEVVPDEQLEARAQAVCAQIAALRPEVAAAFKRVFNRIGLPAFDAAIEQENAVTRALVSGPVDGPMAGSAAG